MRTALVLILAFTTALAGKHFLIETELKENTGDADDDYWKENFDTSENCQNKEEIERLSNLTPSQCIKIVRGLQSGMEDLQSCKKSLGKTCGNKPRNHSKNFNGFWEALLLQEQRT